MNDGVLIRPMEERDLDEVCAIGREAFSMPWNRDGFLYSMNDKDQICLVAQEGDCIAGYGVLICSFDEADIAAFAVKKDRRRRGTGTELLAGLMERGRAAGVERFTLEVRISNESAIRLYRKMGFESVGVRKGFYEKPREDALIMWT